MLEWFGLQFDAHDAPAAPWNLRVRPDATPAQQQHLTAFLARSKS